jgi:hypothetical protein
VREDPSNTASGVVAVMTEFDRLKQDNQMFIDHNLMLVRACKVMLLDAHHRSYLELNDPQALKQMVEAVMNVEPGIIDEMKRAEMNDQESERSARRIARLVQVLRQADNE